MTELITYSATGQARLIRERRVSSLLPAGREPNAIVDKAFKVQ